MDFPDEPGWAEFWATNVPPTYEEAEKLFGQMDFVSLRDSGFVCLAFNRDSGVAAGGLYVKPEFRGKDQGFALLQEMVEQAKTQEMRKISVTVVAGTEFYPGAGQAKGPLGFVLEAKLKGHTRVLGKVRDVLIYSKFLEEQNGQSS